MYPHSIYIYMYTYIYTELLIELYIFKGCRPLAAHPRAVDPGAASGGDGVADGHRWPQLCRLPKVPARALRRV